MGVLKKKFWKICVWIFFFFQNWSKKIWNWYSFIKFSYPIVLFDDKYEFRMILAFIWYAYCPCRCKIVIFQKLTCQKLKNFGVKLTQWGRPPQKFRDRFWVFLPWNTIKSLLSTILMIKTQILGKFYAKKVNFQKKSFLKLTISRHKISKEHTRARRFWQLVEVV